MSGASMIALTRFCIVLCLVCVLRHTARGEEKQTETGRPHDMILIPGGKCVMGLTRAQQSKFAAEYHVSPDLLAMQPYQEVDLPSFWIDKYEVTNSQYRQFLQATGHRPPLAWLDKGFPKGMEDRAVSGVDYHDALAYSRWAGKRLPTEAEWEKAARGAEGRLWPWGNQWKSGQCRMDDSGRGPLLAQPAPVGSFPQDSSVYGVMDMAGNVMEWVEGKLEEPFRYTAITKGGGFAVAAPYLFLASSRIAQPKGNGSVDYIGFRCAKDAKKGEGRPLPSERGTSRQTGGDRLFAPPAKPDVTLYRSKAIRIHPIADLDPLGKYQHQMMVYLPRRPSDSIPLEKMHPWRLELAVPYLPGDRFSVLFEAYWNSRLRLVSRKFSEDRTSVEMVAEKPEEWSVTVNIKGGLDYVDLTYRVKNIGRQDLPTTTETCFPTLAAPLFRDHDGTRTLLMTSQGFKPITELRRPPNPRLMIQDFLLRKEWARQSDKDSGVTGPLIAILARDRRWLVSTASMSGSPFRLVNNREYSCIHCNPPSFVKAGTEATIRERIYFLHGSLTDLAARWKADSSKDKR
jgi:formylglycine-generating enzyme required for sulfatase activity